MKRYNKFYLVVCLCSLTLGGCTAGQSVRIGAQPDDYRTNYPINVAKKDTFFSIPVAPVGKRLTNVQSDQIDNAIRTYDENGSGPIVIRTPKNVSRSKEVERQVRLIVAAFKAKRYYVLTGTPHNDTIGGSTIRIEFKVLKAETKPCGRWPDDILNDQSNRHYANFGCSVQANLAAQIAAPRDLMTPRQQTSIDAERRANVIDDYRSAQPNRTSEINY